MLSPETIAELRREIGFHNSTGYGYYRISVVAVELAKLLDAYESVEKYKKCADAAMRERNVKTAKLAVAKEALQLILQTESLDDCLSVTASALVRMKELDV